jgi:hypothetical protein
MPGAPAAVRLQEATVSSSPMKFVISRSVEVLSASTSKQNSSLTASSLLAWLKPCSGASHLDVSSSVGSGKLECAVLAMLLAGMTCIKTQASSAGRNRRPRFERRQPAQA